MMTRKTVRSVAAWLAVVSWCLLPGALLAAEAAHEVEARGEVMIPMRDGVELSANVFLPKAEGKFPVVLARTPYGKGGTRGGQGSLFASRGYVFISQDCRGRGSSQGDEWVPFVNEARDGTDTHQWILKQPWSNGAIGTTGGSYVGFTQWISAPNAGDYLKAMFPVVPLVDPYHDIAYVGGAFQLSLMMGWGAGVSGKGEVRGWSNDQWQKAFRTLPLRTWDTAIGAEVAYLRDWVAHRHFDDYWKPSRGSIEDIATPIYAVCGWYDLFAKSVLDHVNTVREKSPSEPARRHQHVLMGPWVHGISRDGKVGEIDFGKASVVDLGALQAEWFGHWLKGEKGDVDEWPPLRIFVMGRNQWRDEPQWPLERTRYTPYYFHGQGSANTLDGDGTLSTAKPGQEPADRFDYDPDDPVPTLGGCNLSHCPRGPHDQTQAERRPDVLVFTVVFQAGE